MPRFAANISMLFTELPFLDRVAAAARAGFTAIECQFPYEVAAEDLRTALAAAQLRLVLMNLPAGNWAQGERGIAILPDRVDEFRAGVRTALTYARACDCPRINALAGLQPPTLDTATARSTLIANLRYAANELRQEGRTLLLEPINAHDMPHFFVARVGEALELMAEAACENIRLQYDVYHATRMGDDVFTDVPKLLPAIGHIQFADAPGRGEPGSGAIPFARLFSLIDGLGYDGFTGAEYKPTTSRTTASLAWFTAAAATP